MYAWQRQATLHFLLAETVRHTPHLEPGPARLVADARISLTALRQASARTVSRLANGENPGPEISVDKILLSTTEQEVLEACRRLRPTEFAVGDGRGDQLARADWFYSRMATIYGGTIEIQRSIVAERVLGLPRAGGR
jgi:alkylation response protein AidB-like acyl-CoA dehydrogenase